MNKKRLTVIFSLIVLFIVGWFVYRAFNEREIEVINESDPKNHTLDSKIPPSLKISQPEQKKIEGSEIKGQEAKIPESSDENFEVFDRMEKSWLQKMETIIGPDKYPMYLEMRSQNDKEKMQAYKEYHDYLRQKYGDKFSYNISDDQSIREKKINQRYLKDLLKLIGPQRFKEYTAAKDQFNEELRRNNKEAIQIEF